MGKDMTLTGSGWKTRDDGAKVYGLLLFESPGSVTPDAHSHWVAIRHSRSAQGVFFFRLDPLRGPYSLTAHELSVLLTATGLGELYTQIRDEYSSPCTVCSMVKNKK